MLSFAILWFNVQVWFPRDDFENIANLCNIQISDSDDRNGDDSAWKCKNEILSFEASRFRENRVWKSVNYTCKL